jgi:putative tricarboxylic transport membrane protein
LADVALQFGAREMFAVAVFGLLIIATVLGDSFKRGLLMALLGLLIAAMSADPISAQPRFTMGFPSLYGDVPFIPVIIGLFGFAQMFLLAKQSSFLTEGEAGAEAAGTRAESSMAGVAKGVRATLRRPKDVLWASLYGTGLGSVPGIGTAVANFVSYGAAKRRSKTPEKFGRGSEEGLIASEACDNGVTAGSLAPTLALGIPGSGTGAIMLAALTLNGVQPGPSVLATQSTAVYAIIFGVIISSILILPLGLALALPMAQIVRLKPRMLVPPVLILCVVGAYGVRNSLFDVGLAFVFGIIGLILRQAGYPIVPLIIALILGPIAEGNFARARALGQDSVTYFFASPTAIVLWSLIVIILLVNVLRTARRRKPVSEEDETTSGKVSK